MIRRIVFLGLGVAAVGFFVFGRHAHSYLRTATSWVGDSVKQAVPIEFEIDRARGMVRDIMPEIRKNMQTIAKEEVEVERLSQEIDRLEKKQTKDRTELMSLRSEATSGKQIFQFAGRSYSIEQVKGDLANRFDRYKTTDATLASYHQMLDARQRSLEAAREKLEAMMAQKRQLEVDVENLDAQLKMIEVAQTSSNCSFDDSHLGHVKELIKDLHARISVEDRLVHAESALQGEIPVSPQSTDKIVDRVTEYFNGPSTTVAAVVEVTK